MCATYRCDFIVLEKSDPNYTSCTDITSCTNPNVMCWKLLDYDAVPINRGKQILEDYYIKIWNAIYMNSANISHTKRFIPTIFHRLSLTLWPKFILTQFLTNHGSFRSYLHKINKTPSPNSGCPEKAVQTARHLMTECSLFSSERPAVLWTLQPPLVLKHHINTIDITSFLTNIFHTLQEQFKCNQIP